MASSIEEFTTNFRRDQHPGKEIAIWLKMAEAYQHFISTKPVDLNKKQEAYDLLLLRSMMTEQEVMADVKLQFLTAAEVQAVFDYFKIPPTPVTVRGK